MSAPAPVPFFVCAMVVVGDSDGQPWFGTIWTTLDKAIVRWTRPDGQTEQSPITIPEPAPHGTGPGAWALTVVLIHMIDRGFKGVVQLVQAGAVDADAFDFVCHIVEPPTPTFNLDALPHENQAHPG